VIVRDVSEEIVLAIKSSIGQLNGFHYTVGKVPVPGFTVGPPELIDYDQTYGRGYDKITLPIIFLVGKNDSRSAASQLDAYLDGDGPRSVKAALEAHEFTTCDDVRVVKAVPATYTSGGVDLLGAEFTVDVYGTGA
jgi:hypothetical protein